MTQEKEKPSTQTLFLLDHLGKVLSRSAGTDQGFSHLRWLALQCYSGEFRTSRIMSHEDMELAEKLAKFLFKFRAQTAETEAIYNTIFPRLVLHPISLQPIHSWRALSLHFGCSDKTVKTRWEQAVVTIGKQIEELLATEEEGVKEQ